METLNKVKIFAAILLLTALVFLPALTNDFLLFDDDIHLVENFLVQSLAPSNLVAIFKQSINNIYVPLTTLTFAIEHHFFEFNPVVYHFNNLLLHLLTTACVFVFVRRLDLSFRIAAIAALLFGIHPMRVESVVWVTERKDVLFGLFYMLALLEYVRYVQLEKKWAYWLTLFFGFLSMLAKPMALSLPLILFLCDVYLRRKKSLIMFVEKIPFFAYIIPVAWITFSLNARTMQWLGSESMLLLLWSFAFYIKKFLFPFVLLPVYPVPNPVALTNVSYWSSFIVFVVFCVGLFLFRKNRVVIFSALFYVCSMFFLFRFDNVSDIHMVGDRYIYIPALGFCLLLAVVSDKLLKWPKNRRSLRTGIVISLVMIGASLGIKTFFQNQIWKNDETLWTHEMRYAPTVPLAYNIRGNYYLDKEDFNSALKDYNMAIKLQPLYDHPFHNRGLLYLSVGQYEKAVKDFTKALENNPKHTEALNNRGVSYVMLKELSLARKDFKKGIELAPKDTDGYSNMGSLYDVIGRTKRALTYYDQALRINPSSVDVYLKRAQTYLKRKEYVQALMDYEQVLLLDPENSQALEFKVKVRELLKK